MGKGGKAHEKVIEYLEKTYDDKSGDRKLKSVYPSDWAEKYKKERDLSCDYVGTSKECNALVDVIGNESWMSSLGKVIGYLHEDSVKSGDKEVWLIFYSKSHWTQDKTKSTYQGWEENRYTEYWRAWYKLLLKMSKKVIKSELINRLKFFDYDEDRGLIIIE
jgi:hypothetical protein